MAELTPDLENEARTILHAGFPAKWSSRMLEAWVGEVDRLRAEVERLQQIERATTPLVAPIHEET